MPQKIPGREFGSVQSKKKTSFLRLFKLFYTIINVKFNFFYILYRHENRAGIACHMALPTLFYIMCKIFSVQMYNRLPEKLPTYRQA